MSEVMRRALAARVADPGSVGRFGAEELIPRIVTKYATGDLTVALDSALLKQFLPILQQQFGRIRPETPAVQHRR